MVLNKRLFGFTLAEVLITLGIIGVVAAMTIPTLVNNYLKNQTITKLQKVYTTLYQAIKLSENDNGPTNTWTYGSIYSGNDTLTMFNTYFAPYMKYTNVALATQNTANDSVDVYLIDGIKLRFWYDSALHIFVFLDGGKNPIGGKNLFIYRIIPGITNGKSFLPYGAESSDGTRNFWTSDAAYGCKSTATNSVKPYCAGLIMYDNWQIRSDYPYFN